MCGILYMAIQRLLGMSSAPDRNGALDSLFALFNERGCKQNLG